MNTSYQTIYKKPNYISNNAISLKEFYFYKYNYFSYFMLFKFRKNVFNFYFSKILFYIGHYLNSVCLLSLNLWLIRKKNNLL